MRDILSTTAICGGQVTMSFSQTIQSRGVCWSTSPNPTVANAHTSDGVGTGTFTSSIASLTSATTYYLRAYATNSQGTAYGQQLEVTTSSIYINGSIQGLFSVSATQQVMFSQGNLQYQAGTGIWRFATNQYSLAYDYANGLISSTNPHFIDLFGLGTSGYNNKHPWLSSTSNSDYVTDTYIAGTHYDWGVHNAISNGGVQAGLWRCMTEAEWNYLLNTRTGASSKRALATILWNRPVPYSYLPPACEKAPPACTAVTEATFFPYFPIRG